MIAMARQLFSDFNGLRRVCGNGFALRWLGQVAVHLPTCAKTRNLQAADLAFGRGPVRARFGNAAATLSGNCIVTGVREIWVRDCYLGDGFLSIPDGSSVVDLGANIGTFTMLALAHGPNVRAVAVEPNREAMQHLLEAARLNGFEDRLQVCNCFLGARTPVQADLASTGDYAASPFVTEQEFIDRFRLTKIDLLKCDIEGSEYGLLNRASRLLAMTRQLTIELHSELGDAEAFVTMLRELGFEVRTRRQSAVDRVINARR